MLSPENKQKWIEALRSRVFTQAHGVLRRTGPNKFCCLGVLCEITGHKWDTVHSDGEGYDHLREIGLTYFTSFFIANDLARLSLEAIADQLESGELKVE